MPRIGEARRSAQRRRILDAATACFERSGLDKASMHDIVDESGMSVGAIYRYFDGKEAIVEAVAAERHEYERALLASAIAVSSLFPYWGGRRAPNSRADFPQARQKLPAFSADGAVRRPV